MKKLLALIVSALVLSSAVAQAPAKVTRIIVGYPAGGGTDALARSIAQSLATRWGTPVVVENKVGASGALAADYVSKSPADGLTLLFTDAAPIVILPSFRPEITGMVSQLAPVALVGRQTPALAIGSKVPAQNLAEFIEHAKKNPGLAYGTAGVGSYFHIAMEQLAQRAGISLLHVPYKGVPPMMTDLIGGQLHLAFATMPSLEPFDAEKKVKILAVATDVRAPQRPDVPTIMEAGVPDYAIKVWFGMFAPAGTSAEYLDRINTDVNAILGDPAFATKTLRPQYISRGSESRSQFAGIVRADTQRWGALIKSLGIKGE